jgi:hypothetical protein
MNLQQLIFSQLQADGFMPSYNNADILFKYEGKLLVIHDNESDQNYINLSMPNIHDIKSDSDLIECLKIADQLNGKFKVVKIYTYFGGIWISVQLFIESSPNLDEILMRSISVCKLAQQEFYEQYQKKAALNNPIGLN